MLATWSVECGTDDPVLVVPWSYADAGLTANPATSTGIGPQFIDLRENPYDLDHLPEAELHPAILQALRALNANRSPVFTAKCDAWPLDADETETMRIELSLHVDEHPVGFGSYIDLIWRERSTFTSFHQHEQMLHRLVRHLDPIDQHAAFAECIVRPALVDLTGPQEGFAITLYVKALGHDADAAYEAWSKALEAVVTVIRSKDLAQNRL